MKTSKFGLRILLPVIVFVVFTIALIINYFEDCTGTFLCIKLSEVLIRIPAIPFLPIFRDSISHESTMNGVGLVVLSMIFYGVLGYIFDKIIKSVQNFFKNKDKKAKDF